MAVVRLWSGTTEHITFTANSLLNRCARANYICCSTEGKRRGNGRSFEFAAIRKNQWLLLKTGTSVRPPSKKLEDQSAKTGRTMKQIARDRDAEWESDRDEPATESASGARSILRTRIKAALKKKEEVGPGGSSYRKDGGRPGVPSL